VGRRRKGREIVKRAVKRIPSTFICPYCGTRSITIEIDGEDCETIVRCRCGVKDRVKYFPPFEEVDIYNRFVDKYYGEA
jgi:transcription elongation factor Elf1